MFQYILELSMRTLGTIANVLIFNSKSLLRKTNYYLYKQCNSKNIWYLTRRMTTNTNNYCSI